MKEVDKMSNETGAMAPKVEHAQTILTDKEVARLWSVTDTGTTKDALREAVYFTLKYKPHQKRIDEMLNSKDVEVS